MRVLYITVPAKSLSRCILVVLAVTGILKTHRERFCEKRGGFGLPDVVLMMRTGLRPAHLRCPTGLCGSRTLDPVSFSVSPNAEPATFDNAHMTSKTWTSQTNESRTGLCIINHRSEGFYSSKPFQFVLHNNNKNPDFF